MLMALTMRQTATTEPTAALTVVPIGEVETKGGELLLELLAATVFADMEALPTAVTVTGVVVGGTPLLSSIG